MYDFHPLLARQLKRVGIDIEKEEIPDKYLKLLAYINNSYKESDQGRYVIERAMEISSQEMLELKETLQNEKIIMQSVISEGLCVLDPFWKVTSLNSTAGKLLCCSQAAMHGKFFYEIFSLYESENTQCSEITIDILKERCKEGNIYHCENGFLKTFHGVTRPISFSINPLPLINNRLFGGAVLIFRDITERLETELLLRNSLKAAEQSNKAKTFFLANMSHEIRTPMNGILGMLQLLMHTTLDEKQKHYVQKSFDSANSLLRILGDILDFSKIEAGKIEFKNEEFNFKKELDTLMIIFQTLTKEKKIELELQHDSNIPSLVKGDPLRIKQVINNLVNNAIKFTPAHGKVTLSTKLLKLQNDNISIQVSVSDSGIGIPSNKLEKIFDVFSQADESTTRKYGGTGLGLAITKQLLEQMGGHILVNSVEGQGTTFTCTLNLQAALSAPSSDLQQNIPEQNTHQFHANVLVVEDNQLNQIVVHDMLKSLGCEIDVVGTGMLAVEAVQRKKYDLIFMDCHMPDMDGFVATRRIRELESQQDDDKPRSNSVIIALTANALKGTKERCLDVGMNDYLTKPLNYSKLQETLTKHLTTSHNK
ncbi:MAG: hypothetical protein BGO43_14030 [Gammaproteobacteria bacterium 39-13]|nr:response regulator [Gammaproteobacteria bacterium]OJV89808.1 MAG: hypothetical protein BGO43_14030 [Gammaproteobacteria bacterium 39-13]